MPRTELQQLLADYAGPDRSPDDLLAVRDALNAYFVDAGYPLVIADIPRYQPGGIFQIRVHVITVGDIEVDGNQHFSTASIRYALPALQGGQSPSLERLNEQLGLANENAARQLSLRFRPDEGGGRATVLVEVRDRRPWRTGARVDNTGTDQTGDTRASLILRHDNLMERGIEGTLSLGVSPEKIDRVLQLGAALSIPLPASGDRIAFSASHSDTDSGTIGGIFDVTGEGTSVQGTYYHSLSRTGRRHHQIFGRLGWRHVENDVRFAGVPVGSEVATTPVGGGYRFAGQLAAGHLELQCEALRNIPTGGENDDDAYRETRLGADARWFALRAEARWRQALGRGWSLDLASRAQWSDEPLISAEQIGLGGFYSVRGFEERETGGDKGATLRAQVLSPALDRQRFLAFIDGGVVESHLPGEDENTGAASAGLGWLGAIGDRVTTELMVALALDDLVDTEAGDVRVHFAVNASF